MTKLTLLALIAAILGHTRCAKADLVSIELDMNAMTPKPSTRNVNSSGQAPATPAPSYSPSVPISLYREVTAELQASKATIDALKTQNQQLAKQNQFLRQEIEKAVQSALTLQKTANAIGSIEIDLPTVEPPKASQASYRAPDSEPVFQLPTMPPRPSAKPKIVEAAVAAEELVIEQDSKPRRKAQLEKASGRDLNGWWLGLVIVMIVVTAFGAGFLVVRPLLPSSK